MEAGMVDEIQNETLGMKRPLAWDINLCSQFTSIKVATLRKFVQQNRIPYIKCGKKVLFRPAVIDRWLDEGGASNHYNVSDELVISSDISVSV
jgi:excisionase family DNA binding protein